MRAWRLRDGWSLDHLKLENGQASEPGPGQVAIRLGAASINYRDWLVIHGKYGPRNKLPLVPLSDGAGEVAAVGDGVTRVAVGDRVCPMFFQKWIGGAASPESFQDSLGGPLDGALREWMVLPAEGVARVPPHLTLAEAACLPCAGLTAWSAVVGEGRIAPGCVVVVQGTGGVALFALQFAKMAGATVIVTSSSDEKLEHARALGADHCVNYREQPEWDKSVKELTNGRGCDLVVELGGAGTLPRSVRAARVGATIAMIGVLGGAEGAVALPLIVMRQIRLQGVTVGSRDGFEAMTAAIAAHGARPVIDRIFPFEAAPEALARFAEGGHFGKIAISG